MDWKTNFWKLRYFRVKELLRFILILLLFVLAATVGTEVLVPSPYMTEGNCHETLGEKYYR